MSVVVRKHTSLEKVKDHTKLKIRYTIQYNTTLFYYASHIQQKLVSRWGVGKHIIMTVRTYLKCI